MKSPIRLRYLTDAAWEIYTEEGTVIIDLGEFTPKDLLAPGLAAAICSHQHSDHCDRPKLSELGVPVWAPADTVPLLKADGVMTAHALTVGVPVKVTETLAVTALPVSHGPNAKPIDNFGLMIEVDGWRIWHTGDLGADTEPRPEGPIDLVMIGIGGTYVLDSEGAAAYLSSLEHNGPAIGMHFDYAEEMGPRFMIAGHEAPWAPMLLNSGGSYVLGGGE